MRSIFHSFLFLLLSASSLTARVPFSFDKVTWLHKRVDHWPVTKNLTVEMRGGNICMNVDRSSWPSVEIPHHSGKKKIPVNANGWIFAFHNNGWYGRTWEWWGPNKKCKPMHEMTPGKQPPLTTWKPQIGEVFYVMMSGLARGREKNVSERTNLVQIKWPGLGGGGSGVSVNPPSGSTGSGSPGGSVGANPGGGGTGGPAVGNPGGGGNGEEGLPFSLSQVKWLHPAVGHWPVTSNLNVRVHGPFIDLNYDKNGKWKTIDLEPGKKDPKTVDANPWVFVNQNGTWYAATFEWIRPGATRKHKYSVNGDHIKRPPLNTWSPVPGEVYYFMVSGIARHGHKGSHERSNIVGLKWPPGGGNSQSLPPSQIAPTSPGGFNPGGSGATAGVPGGGRPGAGVPGVGGPGAGGPGAAGPGAAASGAQTLVITCKSKRVLGLFKKKRICGGELFSKLLSHSLVEQLGDKYICTEGSTFGVHDGHAIWVRSCNGRFQVTGIPKGQPSKPAFSGANPNK